MSRTPGKKIGKIPVQTDDGSLVYAELRLHGDGTFFALYEDASVKAKTQDEVTRLIKAEISARSRRTWTRILEIRYQSLAEDGTHFGLSDEPPEPGDLEGIELSWKVYDVSNPYEAICPHRGARMVRIWRELRRDAEDGWQPARYGGRATPGHEVADGPMGPHQIEFTENRLLGLQQIRAAMAELDARLRQFFAPGVAARIDNVLDIRSLLLAGDP